MHRMRLVSRIAGSLVLAGVVACSDSGDESAAGKKPAAQGSKSSTPVPANNAAKAKKAAKTGKPTSSMAEAVDEGDREAPASSKSGASKLSKASMLPGDDRPPGSMKRGSTNTYEPSTGHGRALGFVTKDAWFALRVPQVGGLGEAWNQTALKAALDRAKLPEWFAKQTGGKELLPLIKEKLGPEKQQLAEFIDLLASCDGELVVALLDLDPARIDAGHECPITAAAWLDLGGNAEPMKQLLASLVEDPMFEGKMKSVGEDLYLASDSTVRVELMVKDGYFAALVGPEAPYAPLLDDLASVEPRDSFLASAVLATSPESHGGTGSPWVEAYVNLAPAFAMMRTFAPEDAMSIASMLGLDQIAGFSAVASFDGESLRDVFALISPGREDILTGLFDGQDLSPDFARYAPQDADEASLIAIDFDRAVTSIRGRLPEPVQHMFDDGLAEFRKETGFDLRKDILGLFAGNIAYSMRGNLLMALASAGNPGEIEYDEPVEAVIALELTNAKSMQKLIDKLISQGMLPVSPRKNGDGKYYVVGLPLPGAPSWLEISLAVDDHALVIATTSGALLESLEGAKQGAGSERLAKAVSARPMDAYGVTVASAKAEIDNAWQLVSLGLREAAAHGDAVPFDLPSNEQMSAFASGLHDTVRYQRAGDFGLALDTHGALGSPTIAMAPLAIVASIAIPNLLQARNNANEAAAIATLRNCMSAQAQLQAMACVDQDGDGIGEYGTFGELSGAVKLPSGEVLSPAVLSSSFATVEHGCVARNGYLYRVVLPGKGGRRVTERDSGGIPATVDSDLSEIEFAVYAWPSKHGSTGLRAFMIDQEGEIWTASYEDGFAPYDGFDNPPALDAASHSVLVNGEPYSGARTGSNGEGWVLLR